MPYRNDPVAPKFDGKPTSLSRFLDDIDWAAKQSQLSGRETIQWTIYYAPRDDVVLWKMQESANSNDWDTFQAELHALYPGLMSDRIYTINRLETLITEHAKLTYHTFHDLGQFYREFLKIGTTLKHMDRQTDRELSAHFLHGFDSAFRSKVIDQLRRQNPTLSPEVNIYSVPEIFEVALYILDCEVHDSQEFQVQLTKDPKLTLSRVDLTAVAHHSRSLGIYNNEIIHNPDTRLILDEFQLNLTQDLQITLRRNSRCTFCSSTNHFHRNCPTASRYIDAGYISRDANGHIILPNGMRIQSCMAPGRNIMEKLQHICKKNI